jgi:hypothetical protein
MSMIAKRCFTRAMRVTDRFQMQRLAFKALQEIRIKHRKHWIRKITPSSRQNRTADWLLRQNINQKY